jgi:hypothetical protein
MNNFNPSLPTDLDWVRFLVGDTGECPKLDDETIQAIVDAETGRHGTGEWVRYLAAAEVLDAMLVAWRTENKGRSQEQVSKLSIIYGGVGGTMDAMLGEKAANYRVKAAWLMHPRPRPFAII